MTTHENISVMRARELIDIECAKLRRKPKEKYFEESNTLLFFLEEPNAEFDNHFAKLSHGKLEIDNNKVRN